MGAIGGIVYRDGRPVISGCGVLPPMNDDLPTKRKPADSVRANLPEQKKTTKTAAADRFGVLNGFVDCSMTGLGKADIATWLVLFRDTRNGSVSISQANIARRAGVSDRAVRTAIEKLVGNGLLTVLVQGGLNRGVSRYRVNPQRKRHVTD